MVDEPGSVVILATDCDATRAVYHALQGRVRVLRVILEERVTRRALLRARARRIGVARSLSQLAFVATVVPALRVAGRRRLAELRSRIHADAPIPEAAISRVTSVNSAECVDLVQKLSPKVLVVSGTRIIGAALLGATSATVINMHCGITPRYRGTHGAYWARAEGRPESAGVTVHLVDRGIDTGNIVAQAIVKPEPEDTFVTLPLLQIEAGLPLFVDATLAALRGSLTTVPSLDATASKLWLHPTLREYVTHWLRDGVR